MWPAPQYPAASPGPAHESQCLCWANTGHTSPKERSDTFRPDAHPLFFQLPFELLLKENSFSAFHFYVDLFLACILVIPKYVNCCSDANINHILKTGRNIKQQPIQFSGRKISCRLLLNKIRREINEILEYFGKTHLLLGRHYDLHPKDYTQTFKLHGQIVIIYQDFKGTYHSSMNSYNLQICLFKGNQK